MPSARRCCRLRGGGTVPHEVLQRVLTVLDIEERSSIGRRREDIEGREDRSPFRTVRQRRART